jgi:hypothetical protein
MLPALQILDVSENGIADLGPLASFATLGTLDASENPITSIANLAGTRLASSLQTLLLRGDRLSALDGVPSGANYLDLSGNRVCDFASLAPRIVARIGGQVSYDCGEQSCYTGGFVATAEIDTGDQDRAACAPDPVATERAWNTVLRCQTSELQVDPADAKHLALIVTQGQQSFWYEGTPVTNLYQYAAGRTDVPTRFASDYGSYALAGTSSVAVTRGADFQRLDAQGTGDRRAELVREGSSLHLRIFEGSAQRFDWVFPGCTG